MGSTLPAAPDKALHAPPVPERYERWCRPGDAEQEPLLQVLAEPASLPILRHVWVPSQGLVGFLGLPKVLGLEAPALLGLLLFLWVCARELYAELPSQIQGRTDAGLDAFDAGPQIGYVAVPAAAVAAEAACRGRRGSWGSCPRGRGVGSVRRSPAGRA